MRMFIRYLYAQGYAQVEEHVDRALAPVRRKVVYANAVNGCTHCLPDHLKHGCVVPCAHLCTSVVHGCNLSALGICVSFWRVLNKPL